MSENVGASAEEIATAILRGASEFAEGVLREDVVVLVIRKLSDVEQEVALGSSKSRYEFSVNPQRSR